MRKAHENLRELSAELEISKSEYLAAIERGVAYQDFPTVDYPRGAMVFVGIKHIQTLRRFLTTWDVPIHHHSPSTLDSKRGVASKFCWKVDLLKALKRCKKQRKK